MRRSALPAPLAALMALLVSVLAPVAAWAGFTFASIDGGTIDLDDWSGKPVLVVNTASLCGFAGQFDDLQALHDELGPKGLLVLAVPSNDFSQELGSEAAVKEYCALNFDLTLPMTQITHVKGAQAHPFYAWLAKTRGFVPGWNFNKVLLGPDGAVIETWGSTANPQGAIRRRILSLLP
ncbi:glutathione peroxidase [Fuscovulum blasticum]|uniref:glutathione peroxidase n=1 Tax=Fuscovulum blasticum TaxID=1075 RepID=UPI000D3E2D54|nr:glutathione peroxidase [Fuscovulum blasticum]AWD21156.1 glutathione peroxidase [Fuscovulum blasticum]